MTTVDTDRCWKQQSGLEAADFNQSAKARGLNQTAISYGFLVGPVLPHHLWSYPSS